MYAWEADRVLHRYLHPGNVILAPGGPVVIDGRDAGAGDPAAEGVMTVVTVAGAEVSGLAARSGTGPDPARGAPGLPDRSDRPAPGGD
ncbi:hypothetical protein GCM10027160_03290 [Streptomyces calidiresistens]